MLVGKDDKGNLIGTYGTLDEALEGVDPYTTIYLTEGVYNITEPITKPGLIIEKRDKDEKVYIIGNEGPVIKVELESGDFINYVTFKNLIILHSGASIQYKFKENAPQEPKYCMEAGHKAIREFEVNDEMDTVCFVASGGILFRNCTLSLKSHPKKLKSRLPVLVSLPNTLVNLTSCKMIGHESNHNCGCIHINSHVFISDTEFTNFNAGGIYCLAKPKPVNKVKIMDSQISNCKVMGIYLQGEGAR